MNGMPEQFAGECGESKPRSGCWFWGLVIAGAVVGLLMILVALVMIPMILGGGGARHSKQAEAKTNLGAIFTCQVAYYGEYNTYAGGRNCFEDLGWSPEGETKFNYYCGDEVIFCTQPGCDRCLSAKLPGGKANKQGGALDASGTPHSETEILDGARSTADAFTVYAVGNIDGDPNCDVWSMRDDKSLINDHNDVAD
jgi:hypothetical protein